MITLNDLPMGGCSRVSEHNRHLSEGDPHCENQFCLGCHGSVDVVGTFGSTLKCVDCVRVDIHNYRALHDGRYKMRSYKNRSKS